MRIYSVYDKSENKCKIHSSNKLIENSVQQQQTADAIKRKPLAEIEISKEKHVFKH